MPKENVDCIAMNGFRAEVSWGPQVPGERLGHVQLATVNTKSTLAMPSGEGEESEPFDGWYVTLERPSIDRLIQALIKARDAAYPEGD